MIAWLPSRDSISLASVAVIGRIKILPRPESASRFATAGTAVPEGGVPEYVLRISGTRTDRARIAPSPMIACWVRGGS